MGVGCINGHASNIRPSECKVIPHSKFVVWISDKTMRDINLRYKYFEVGGW